MKIRVSILLAILLSATLTLSPESIKFIRAIQIKNRLGKKSIGTFLLGKKKEEKIKPNSLCRITPNTLCVTDAINGLIVILDNDGNILKRIATVKGVKLISPVSSCVDDKGNLYVSDSGNRMVLQFNKKYKFSKIFIVDPKIRITGITFFQGTFYCVDTANHRILCFNRQGVLKFFFGKRGSAKGEFNYPTHITADKDCIYITDSMNFRVQIFNHSGEFVNCFGSAGRGGGNFSKPKGIAVNREKQIFVTDAMFDNIQIFNIKGEFLYVFGGPGHELMGFWMPLDVMIDRDNLVWVADTYNNRLQVFKVQREQR